MNKADLTAIRSDFGISCIRLVLLAMDIGEGEPMPQPSVPLRLSFNPTPSYLRTDVLRHHPEPPTGAKPPLKLSGRGTLLGVSQPVYTGSAPWCALLLPALLTPHLDSTLLPRRRESRSKYPVTRVSGQQESSSVGVLSGSSLCRFCTPPANPRSSKL